VGGGYLKKNLSGSHARIIFKLFNSGRYIIAAVLLTSLSEKCADRKVISKFMSKKIMKLEFENDFEFLLAGVITGHKDYRLCYEINDFMKLNFLRKKDVIVPAGKPGSSTRHSYFSCPGKDNEYYHIISNRDKDGTGFFIPEQRSIDFFLLVSNPPPNFNINNLINKTREVDNISGVYEIEPSEIKSAEAFLLFLEA
jgi:hypothetical protein